MVEIKGAKSSGSESEIGTGEQFGTLHRLIVNQVIENYLAAKRVKTHHEQEAYNEVEMVVSEDSDGDSSPLTELSSLSSANPLTGTPLQR